MLSKTKKKKSLFRPTDRTKYHANFDYLHSGNDRIICLMNRAGLGVKILNIWYPVCVFKGAIERSNSSAVCTILELVYVETLKRLR